MGNKTLTIRVLLGVFTWEVVANTLVPLFGLPYETPSWIYALVSSGIAAVLGITHWYKQKNGDDN